ncbi:MAG: rod shape-determining protein MreD [Deltaproteobacteria bacterium]|nr:rod shape-determining protein MreD [Deltaproteobacteria bacterium]
MPLLFCSGVSAILLQTTAFHYLPWIPDLLLILCVYLGIYHRSAGGAAGAFFLGYGLDTCSGVPVGMNAFAMSLVFAGVTAVSRCLWLTNPVSVLFMVFLAVVLKTSAFLFLGEFGELTEVFQPMVARYVMWDATVAIVLTPLVFTLLYRGEPFDYRV